MLIAFHITIACFFENPIFNISVEEFIIFLLTFKKDFDKLPLTAMAKRQNFGKEGRESGAFLRIKSKAF
jgi:hypothetical protein